MLKRKIDKQLLAWKNNKDHKCLVVQGARQVGKTFSIREFGNSNYEELLEINFKKTPSAAQIFSGDLDVNSIIMAMRFRFPDMSIRPGSTLIFLDEIQECPEAITALKFFSEDRRYDVVASGSLLGIDYKRPSSYPVGYTEYLRMYGLDFEEFLWAYGISDDMFSSLKDFFVARRPVPDSVNKDMMNYFRMYIATGGMPEVVEKFMDTRDFREVDRIQSELLQGYLYDIAHYATAEEKSKAERCYLSLSKQLLDKENHKFQYKEIEHGARAVKYSSSLDWLERADIAVKCRAVTGICYDLNDYARDDFFRMYTTDLSLLISMRDLSLKQRIVENTLSGTTKGGIYECAIADILYKKGYSLFFYKNESTRKEIDFLIQINGEVIPIEVKSGNNRASSLNDITQKNSDITTAFKLIDGNIGADNSGIVTLPLYMAIFI